VVTVVVVVVVVVGFVICIRRRFITLLLALHFDVHIDSFFELIGVEEVVHGFGE
jgi:hypothetical protein